MGLPTPVGRSLRGLPVPTPVAAVPPGAVESAATTCAEPVPALLVGVVGSTRLASLVGDTSELSEVVVVGVDGHSGSPFRGERTPGGC
jgi:hypothetical protein